MLRDSRNVTNAVKSGRATNKRVKFRLKAKLLNRNIPFGLKGVEESNKCAFGSWVRILYPLTKRRDDRAEKQGFSYLIVMREKKLT